MASRGRPSRFLVWLGAGSAALALIVAVALTWLAHADLREPAARLLAARVGMPVRILGELELDLYTLEPRAVATRLEIGESRIERVSASVRLLPFVLRGELELPQLVIERPDVYLVRDGTGSNNWPARRGQRRPGRAPALPIVHDFRVHSGRVTFVDHVRHLIFTGSLEAREGEPDGGASPLVLESRGLLNGRPFGFRLRGGALAEVRRGRPYPFRYVLTADRTRMTASGAIARPFDFGEYHADITLKGDDVADLFYLTELTLPNTPPYEVTGHVQRAGSQLYLQAFRGVVGESDVDLEASVDLSRERPLVTADVYSSSLDFEDLGATFGTPPTRRRLFPRAQLRVHRLRSMDADVQFRADTVRTRKVPLSEVSFHLKLEEGVLRLDPVSFVLPHGRLAGTASVDARQDLPQTTLDARLTGLELGQFKSRTAEQPPLEGLLMGRARLQGYGSSIHEVMSTSDGELTLVLPKGEIREAFAELTGINVSRGLGLLMRKDEKQTAIRCGVADFAVKSGRLQAKSIVVDTDDVVISGRGEIDLDAEAYDLAVEGDPKKLRLFRLRSPIAIRGPLLAPQFDPKTGDSLRQTGIAAALGTIVAPLAAVLAFVDPGLAEDVNCAALLAEAKRNGAPVRRADVDRAKRG